MGRHSQRGQRKIRRRPVDHRGDLGLKSSYGAEKDRWDLFRSLATLAEIKFRQPYFRDELLTALEFSKMDI